MSSISWMCRNVWSFNQPTTTPRRKSFGVPAAPGESQRITQKELLTAFARADETDVADWLQMMEGH
jgi:hypothetical protein